MAVVLRIVIGNAGLPRVHVGATKLLGGHDLAGGRLHQRRAAEKDGALVAHDDALVRHRRHIGAAGSAGPHHDGDLRNALRGHLRLIVEDAAEMPLVRKYLVLHRQEGAAGIDHVDAGQIVLPRDVLRAQVLLHGHRIIGATLDGGVIGDDDAFAARNASHAGDDAGGMDIAAIKAVGGERRQLKKRGAGIDQQVDTFARQHLAARRMPLAGNLTAAAGHDFELLAKLRHQAAHHVGVAGKLGRRGIDGGVKRHGRRFLWMLECPEMASGWSEQRVRRECDSLYHLGPDVKLKRSFRTVPGRSACGGFRWCRRRSHRVLRRAAAGRSDSR